MDESMDNDSSVSGQMKNEGASCTDNDKIDDGSKSTSDCLSDMGTDLCGFVVLDEWGDEDKPKAQGSKSSCNKDTPSLGSKHLVESDSKSNLRKVLSDNDSSRRSKRDSSPPRQLRYRRRSRSKSRGSKEKRPSKSSKRDSPHKNSEKSIKIEPDLKEDCSSSKKQKTESIAQDLQSTNSKSIKSSVTPTDIDKLQNLEMKVEDSISKNEAMTSEESNEKDCKLNVDKIIMNSDELSFGRTKLNELISSGIPLVGVNYMIEVRNKNAGTNQIEYNFICGLCNMKASEKTFVDHINSVPHKYRFTKYHYPAIHDKYSSAAGKWKSQDLKNFSKDIKFIYKEMGFKNLVSCEDGQQTKELKTIRDTLKSLLECERPQEGASLNEKDCKTLCSSEALPVPKSFKVPQIAKKDTDNDNTIPIIDLSESNEDFYTLESTKINKTGKSGGDQTSNVQNKKDGNDTVVAAPFLHLSDSATSWANKAKEWMMKKADMKSEVQENCNNLVEMDNDALDYEEDIDGVPLDLETYEAKAPSESVKNPSTDAISKVKNQNSTKKAAIKFEVKALEEKKLNKIMVGPMIRKKNNSCYSKAIIPKIIPNSKQEGEKSCDIRNDRSDRDSRREKKTDLPRDKERERHNLRDRRSSQTKRSSRDRSQRTARSNSKPRHRSNSRDRDRARARNRRSPTQSQSSRDKANTADDLSKMNQQQITLWVGSVPDDQERNIRKIFSRYGTITFFLYLKAKCCIFVGYNNIESGFTAMDDLKHFSLCGKAVPVRLADVSKHLKRPEGMMNNPVRKRSRSNSRARSRDRERGRKNNRKSRWDPSPDKSNSSSKSKGYGENEDRGHSDDSNSANYLKELGNLIAELMHQLDRYTRNPKAHPSYEWEYRKFCDEKNVGFGYGNSQNNRAEWEGFWKEGLSNMLENEFRLKKKQLLDKYNVDDPYNECQSFLDKITPSLSRSNKSDHSLQKQHHTMNYETSSNFKQNDKMFVINTLKMTSILNYQLGTYAIPLQKLLSEATELFDRGESPVDLFLIPGNLFVLKKIRETLSSQIAFGSFPGSMKSQSQNIIDSLNDVEKLVGEMASRDSKPKQSESEIDGLDIVQIAKATSGYSKAQISQHIAGMLHKIGQTNVNENQLQKLLDAVLVIQSMKGLNKPSPPASSEGYSQGRNKVDFGDQSYKPYWQQSWSNQQQQQQQTNESQHPSGFPQNYNSNNFTKSNKFSSCTINELSRHIYDFEMLDQEDQTNLMDYLTEFEKVNSDKLGRLKQLLYINCGITDFLKQRFPYLRNDESMNQEPTNYWQNSNSGGGNHSRYKNTSRGTEYGKNETQKSDRSNFSSFKNSSTSSSSQMRSEPYAQSSKKRQHHKNQSDDFSPNSGKNPWMPQQNANSQSQNYSNSYNNDHVSQNNVGYNNVPAAFNSSAVKSEMYGSHANRPMQHGNNNQFYNNNQAPGGYNNYSGNVNNQQNASFPYQPSPWN